MGSEADDILIEDSDESLLDIKEVSSLKFTQLCPKLIYNLVER